ncbi:hypothetical protein [Spirosoma flavum]|uniref:Uncharacterized protein n=1 Tax=Spirosoma flavum TaxID=2048557 RepID=A0ABW6AF68_9BACT
MSFSKSSASVLNWQSVFVYITNYSTAKRSRLRPYPNELYPMETYRVELLAKKTGDKSWFN